MMTYGVYAGMPASKITNEMLTERHIGAFQDSIALAKTTNSKDQVLLALEHSSSSFVLLIFNLHIRTLAGFASYAAESIQGMGNAHFYHFNPATTPKLTEHPGTSQNCASESTDELAIQPLSTSSTQSISGRLTQKAGCSGHNDESDGEQFPRRNRDYPNPLSNCQERYFFACHFHKHAPSRYSAVGTDLKYEECAGHGWQSISILKNHLRRTHFSFHCAGCNIAFSEQHQLETHYRDAERCHQTEVQHNEGIDPLQWQSICRLDIKERYRKDLFTGRCRWYDIWKILFPSEAAPPHPWYEVSVAITPGEGKGLLEPTHDFCSSPTNINGTPLPEDNDTKSSCSGQELVLTTKGWSLTPHLSESSSGPSTMSSESFSWDHILWTLPYLQTDCFSHSVFLPPTLDPDIGVSEEYAELHLLRETQEPGHVSMEESIEAVLRGDEAFSSPADSLTKAIYMDYIDLSKETCQLVMHESQDLDMCQETVTKPSTPKQEWTVSGDWEGMGEDRQNSLTRSPRDNANGSTEVLGFQEENGVDAQSCWASGAEEGYDIENWFRGTGFEAIEIRVAKDALASEPTLFAQSIPLFQAQWQRKNLSPGIVSCAMSEDNPSVATPSSTQKSDSKRGAGLISRGNTCPEKSSNEEDNDDDDEESRRGNKRQRVPRDPSEEYRGMKFACHFHKINPEVYVLTKDPNLSTKEQIRWRSCGSQGSIGVRHLVTDHLKLHKIFDCTECFKEFDTPETFMLHKSRRECDGQPPMQGPRRDGITVLQWDEIAKILKNRTIREFSKWMKIWTILFPYAPPPKSPYTFEDDEPIQIPRSSPAVESFLNTWRVLIQGDIREGLRYDDQTHYRYETLLRKAFEIEHGKISETRVAVEIPTPSSSGRTSIQQVSGFGSPLSHGRVSSVDEGAMIRPRSVASKSFHSSPSPMGPPNTTTSSTGRPSNPMPLGLIVEDSKVGRGSSAQRSTHNRKFPESSQDTQSGGQTRKQTLPSVDQGRLTSLAPPESVSSSLPKQSASYQPIPSVHQRSHALPAPQWSNLSPQMSREATQLTASTAKNEPDSSSSDACIQARLSNLESMIRLQMEGVHSIPAQEDEHNQPKGRLNGTPLHGSLSRSQSLVNVSVDPRLNELLPLQMDHRSTASQFSRVQQHQPQDFSSTLYPYLGDQMYSGHLGSNYTQNLEHGPDEQEPSMGVQSINGPQYGMGIIQDDNPDWNTSINGWPNFGFLDSANDSGDFGQNPEDEI